MMRLFAYMGQTIERAVHGAGEALTLLFDSAFCVRHAWKRRKFLLDQLYTCAIRPLPVVLVVALFTGMILALQTGIELERFGATERIASIIGLSLCREMGPFMTALILTASVGAGMAAEIGTMKVSEEIDALRVMGINPRAYLLVPKLLALTLGTPVLVVLSSLVGIAGGFVVALLGLHLPFDVYWDQTLKALHVRDLVLGAIKALVFGALIGLTGCTLGMRVRGGATGVGRVTTTAVVTSYVLVIIANTFFTLLFFLAGW
jgi:phospholipid/cholesterol/gamma-HCH transport system permease protein